MPISENNGLLEPLEPRGFEAAVMVQVFSVEQPVIDRKRPRPELIE